MVEDQRKLAKNTEIVRAGHIVPVEELGLTDEVADAIFIPSTTEGGKHKERIYRFEVLLVHPEDVDESIEAVKKWEEAFGVYTEEEKRTNPDDFDRVFTAIERRLNEPKANPLSVEEIPFAEKIKKEFVLPEMDLKILNEYRIFNYGIVKVVDHGKKAGYLGSKEERLQLTSGATGGSLLPSEQLRRDLKQDFPALIKGEDEVIEIKAIISNVIGTKRQLSTPEPEITLPTQPAAAPASSACDTLSWLNDPSKVDIKY